MLLKVVFFLTMFLAVFGNSVQVAQDTAVEGAEEFPACRCTFYEHCGYKGKRYCYNGNTRFVGLKINDRISAVRVTPGWMCKVFQHAHFRGASLIFRKNDKCLTNNLLKRTRRIYKSWNDQISSIQVLRGPCRCRFFEHCGYKGRSVCYNSSTRWVGRVANDKFSAVQVARGFKCTAYQHIHFKGHAITFRANDRCLTNNPLVRKRWPSWNDVISSVRVARVCPCRLYQHCGYRGYSTCFRSSTRFVGKRVNDQYSSIRVARGFRCQVFEHAHFRGARTTFGRSDSCFLNNKLGRGRGHKTFNDVISSIKVSRTRNWQDYDDEIAQEQNNYYGFAVGGAVMVTVAGLGLFAYQRRRKGDEEEASNKEYEVLLQQEN